MSTKGKPLLLSTRACDLCGEALSVYQTKYGQVTVERASEVVGEKLREHACWDLPQDANLIVLKASPEGR